MKELTFQAACLRFLILPYIWGGDDPILGFDCSGLVQELLAMIGLDPPGDQTAQSLYDHFKSRSTEGPRACGTLVFFGSSISKITHVGLMLDDVSMIEAAGGGSKTTSMAQAATQNAYIRVRPYSNRKDLIAIVNPRGLPW